jgi:hypothetical protein
VLVLEDHSKDAYNIKWLLPSGDWIWNTSYNYLLSDKDTGLKKVCLVAYSRRGDKVDSCVKYIRVYKRSWMYSVVDGSNCISNTSSNESNVGYFNSSFKIYLSGTTLPSVETDYTIMDKASFLTSTQAAYIEKYSSSNYYDSGNGSSFSTSTSGILHFKPAVACQSINSINGNNILVSYTSTWTQSGTVTNQSGTSTLSINAAF